MVSTRFDVIFPAPPPTPGVTGDGVRRPSSEAAREKLPVTTSGATAVTTRTTLPLRARRHRSKRQCRQEHTDTQREKKTDAAEDLMRNLSQEAVPT